MPLSPNATVFTVWTMVTCFGSGFSAAIQNVALIMYTENGGKESGKLFGAISVIQTLWSVFFLLIMVFVVWSGSYADLELVAHPSLGLRSLV